jgi:hypothetical protein
MRNFIMGVLGLVIALTAGASAAGPDVKYKDRGPRTASLICAASGTSAPTCRSNGPRRSPIESCSREEFDKRRTARRNTLGLVRTFAPVEAIGLD